MSGNEPIDPTWYRPRSSTCIVWAFVQKRRFAGQVGFIWNPHFRWLYRALWSPDGVHWYGYIPISPRRSALAATFHSIWFKGKLRAERTPAHFWLKLGRPRAISERNPS